MKRAIQNVLLKINAAAARSGITQTRLGRQAFLYAYRIYKGSFESGWRHLRNHVAPDTIVIDVGANVGFFTLPFAEWVSGKPAGVIAIEPEPENLRSLKEAIAASPHAQRVEVIQAALADSVGERHLALNPANPADHRLAETGIAVAATTLDQLLAERGWPRVSLIKIDVQGAELLVLRGGVELLRRDAPALYIEIDDSALSAAGTSADDLITFLAGFGYAMHQFDEHGSTQPVSRQTGADLRAELGYADFLFLRAPCSAAGQAPGHGSPGIA